jgi:hypothetical protein
MLHPFVIRKTEIIQVTEQTKEQFIVGKEGSK